ncbi:MAG: hypothetical protein IKI04_00440, partial [Bacilli bacterium]|nr:hypothetical protein [Bacilli bacterium]
MVNNGTILMNNGIMYGDVVGTSSSTITLGNTSDDINNENPSIHGYVWYGNIEFYNGSIGHLQQPNSINARTNYYPQNVGNKYVLQPINITDGALTSLWGNASAGYGQAHNTSATTWSAYNPTGAALTSGTIANATWDSNYLAFNGNNSWVNLGTGMNSEDYMTLQVTFSVDSVLDTKDQYIIGNKQSGGLAIYIDNTG